MKIIHYATVLIACAFMSCWLVHDPNRNKILFNDEVEIVQKTLSNLIPILDSLPEIPEEMGVARHYYLNDSILYINNYSPVKLDYSTIPGVLKSDSENFVRSILFLQKNHISGAYRFNDIWFFTYRKLYNEYNDGYRDIVLNKKNADTLNLAQFYKIIDKKDNLLLVVPKDAKIE